MVDLHTYFQEFSQLLHFANYIIEHFDVRL